MESVLFLAHSYYSIKSHIMNKINILFLPLFYVLLTACQHSRNEVCSLVSTQDSLVFELNPQTSVFAKAIFLYTDANGREYLTFQNDIEPEILWYDIATQEYVKTLCLEKEGPNGVGMFFGYLIQSEEEIYIPEIRSTVIDVVNNRGEITRKIRYDKTSLGKSAMPIMNISFPHHVMHIVDGRLYLPQDPNLTLKNIMEDSPVALVLDTVSGSLDEFELRFPAVMTTEEMRGNKFGKTDCSSCYNGQNFVYSFFFDEVIYVVSLDGKVQKQVKVKSNYLPQIYDGEKVPSGIPELLEMICSVPMYGNLIYDQYREVYYRFVYPETELVKGENYKDIWDLGRSKFSVIILDKELNIIGETLFPENMYASRLFFVSKDGLYISTSFIKNPHYSDERLCFQRMDLVYE